jgi:hypothetical protein
MTLIAGFFVGLWWLLRYVVAPAVVIAAVLAWRWLSGAAMTGKPRPATFLRAGVPPRRPARRFALRINWAYWPGWQRAIVRWVATVLVVAGLLWPVATTTVAIAVVLAAVVARYRYAIAEWVRSLRPRSAVVRVPAQVTPSQSLPLTACSGDQVWSAMTPSATTRGGIR